jgi:hypothetical protein
VSFTYTAQPATVTRDALRFLVQDTDKDDPLLFDEELDWLLATEGNARRAAVPACEAIVGKLARRVTVSVDGISKSLSDMQDKYAKLLPILKRRAALGSTGVYSGGISISDRDAREENTDRVEPAFTRERFAIRTVLDGDDDPAD